MGPVAQAGVFVGPVLQQLFHVTVGGDETVRPKRYATLLQPGLDLRGGRLKDGGAGNRHLEFAFDATQASQHSVAHFADQLDGEAARLAFRRNAMFGETCRPQLARQRGRASTVTDDLDFFFLHINVLKISIVNGFLAQLGKQKNGEGGVEVSQRRRSVAVFQHHALRKASCGVVVPQTRERLHGIEIKLLPFHNFLQRQVQADGTLVDDGRLRRRAKQLCQTGTERIDFLLRDGFGGTDQFGGVARVDVNTEHAHPLRRVGHAAGLTHASAAKGPDGGKIQPILQAGGSRVRRDLLHRGCILGGAVHEFVGKADFQKSTVHHQTSYGAPTLRSGMSPQHHALPRGCEFAHRAHQVGGPNPGAGKQNHGVDLGIVLHAPQRRDGFLFGRDHNFVPDQLDPGCGERLLGSRDDCCINEWLAHGILQAIFVYAVNNKADCGFDHVALLRKLAWDKKLERQPCWHRAAGTVATVRGKTLRLQGWAPPCP